jgi:hypothetical protein
MKKLHCFLLIFVFCFSTIIFAQIIPNFKVNERGVDTNYSSGFPKISVHENGDFIITWEDHRNEYRDIYAQRYSSDGTALGSNFIVNDDTSDGCVPSITTDNNGNFIIAWKSAFFGIEPAGYNLYARLYTNNGIPIEGQFRVNDVKGSVSGSYSGRPAPSIASDNNGNFVITWEDRTRDEDGHLIGRDEVYAQRYSNNGTAQGSNFKVNDDSSDAEMPSISSDNNGNFVITWHDNRNGNYDIYAQRYASDGTAQGSNFKVSDDTSNAVYPSISTDNKGNFVITFMYIRDENWYFWDVYIQRYSSDGIPLGTNLKVNDDVCGAGLGVYAFKPSISLDNEGNFVINWVDWVDYSADELEYEFSINAQRYSSEGVAIGNSLIVTNSSETRLMHPELKLLNGRIYNVWELDPLDTNFIYVTDVWANVLDWDNPVNIIKNIIPQNPSVYKLSQNYPNPFNPTTTINYELPITNYVHLSVYNLVGQKVATLVSERKQAGHHQVEWDASGFASGVYYYRIQAGEFVDFKKMILIK